jgi:hypothetical protein
MASTSKLRTQKTTSAQANSGQPWGDLEASTEVLADALAGLTVGASTAAAAPGSDATTVFAVQGVTGGKSVSTSDTGMGEVQATPTANTLLRRLKDILSLTVLAAGTNLIGKVGIDQTTPGATNATQAKQYTGVPSNFALASADATVFTLAAGEVGFIQNLSADAPLAVKFGASASTTSLSLILKASTAASDGTGGQIKIDSWVGAVSVAKMTGTASYIAWKQAA